METKLLVLLVLLTSLSGICAAVVTDITVIRNFVEEHDVQLLKANSDFMSASWNYYTNMTEHNLDIMTEYQVKLSKLNQAVAERASEFDLDSINNKTLKRMVQKIADVGISGSKDETIPKRITELKSTMTELYSLAKWCKTPENCKPMDPDLDHIMSFSRDYEELLAAWKGWRDVSGKKLRQMYLEYAHLKNVAVRSGGRYSDIGEYYRSWYESATFEDDVRALFTELQPLYSQLHAYVRHKLRDHYGQDKFPESGHIPAHILGNMWAQKWTNLFDLLVPYPGFQKKSLTEVMKEQGWTVRKMYDLSEEMFKSIGLGPLPDSFWTNSILTEPTDGRKFVCHASAWDMYNGTDVRIKMCTSVTEDQFEVVQHEMGHLYYDLEYIRQPFLFRDGANPGFHEAVASMIVLSSTTPEHLKKIGLIDSLPSGQEQDINVLLKTALNIVAFLPFGYLIDQWRWSLYRGEVTPDNLNSAWWDLRCGFQGIYPPVERSEEDFDPGAKYHVPGEYPYIRYFVSTVAMYQWHDSLCELIGHTGPLHRCNIYGQKTAGKRLREMLRMGSSRHWGEAMRAITRGTSGETDKLSARSILKYFRPLQEWLEQENLRMGETIGWNTTVCPNVLYGRRNRGNGLQACSATSLCMALMVAVMFCQLFKIIDTTFNRVRE